MTTSAEQCERWVLSLISQVSPQIPNESKNASVDRRERARTKLNHVHYMNISWGHLLHQWYYLLPQKRLWASRWCSWRWCLRLERQTSSRNILTGESRERKVSFWRTNLLGSYSETPNLTVSTTTPLLIHGRLSFSQPDQGCQAVWRFQSFFPSEGRGWGFGFNVIGMSVMASLAYPPGVCCRWHGRQ